MAETKTGVMAPRIEVNRVKLSEKIPLSTPYSVTIVPSSFCNFACTFCPCRTMQYKAAIMPFEKFKNIIDNAGFPEQVKVLHMYNIGEPLFNKDLPKMISYAKQSGFAKRISMVTNASLLTKEKADALISSGVNRIIISLYGMCDEDYKKTTQRDVSFDMIYENIKYLNSIKGDCDVFVKVIDRATPTEIKRQEFIEKFKDNCTYYSIETILPIWPNFRPEDDESSNIKITTRGLYEGVPAEERLACHYPFYSMVVNPNGLVNPCLADWDESVTLGDTSKKSLCEIWNSKEYDDFRLLQLSGKRPKHYLCATCGTLAAATPGEDDINEDRLKLLHKLFPNYKENIE